MTLKQWDTLRFARIRLKWKTALSRFNREMDFYLTTSPSPFPPFPGYILAMAIYLKSKSVVENTLSTHVNKYLGSFTATQIKQCFTQNKVKQRSKTYFFTPNNFCLIFFTSFVLLGTVFLLKLKLKLKFLHPSLWWKQIAANLNNPLRWLSRNNPRYSSNQLPKIFGVLFFKIVSVRPRNGDCLQF